MEEVPVVKASIFTCNMLFILCHEMVVDYIGAIVLKVINASVP